MAYIVMIIFQRKMPKASELGVDNVLEVITETLHLDGYVRGQEYVISCPNPDHDDNNPSCSVNLVTGLWHCFSCNASGDLLRLGNLVTGWTFDESKKQIVPDDKQAILNKIRALSRNAGGTEEEKRHKILVPDFPSYYEDEPLDFLIRRGFQPETLKRWGVQFVKEENLVNKQGKSFTIRNCIAIPLRDYRGLLKGWIYRKTDNSVPKYLYTPNLPIGNYWFGESQPGKSPIIVEGSLDVIWLSQAGLYGLGMLGSNADSKIEFLYQFSKVILFPDKDLAGIKWMNRHAEDLSKRTNVLIVRYPKDSNYKDPQEVPAEILHKMVHNAVPWFWIQKGYS